MSLQEAYKMVYDDMVNSECGLLVGTFDATNGKKEFIFGIQTVMEWIAYRADDTGKTYEDFDKLFLSNFCKSIDKTPKA